MRSLGRTALTNCLLLATRYAQASGQCNSYENCLPPGEKVVTESCPREVQRQLFEILRWGILNIRTGSETNDCRVCNIEANHLHNIPDLLEEFSRDRLAYYLKVEVAKYERGLGAESLPRLRAAWVALEEWLKENSG